MRAKGTAPAFALLKPVSSFQVAAAKAEARHNQRHFKAATLELSEVKKELQAKELLVQTLQAAAERLQ